MWLCYKEPKKRKDKIHWPRIGNIAITWMPCLLYHHLHTSRDTPGGNKEEIVRWRNYIYSPRNAVQNIRCYTWFRLEELMQENSREGDLYYATAGQKLPFAMKKRKRKETFVFLFAPSSWPKAYLLISSPGDNATVTMKVWKEPKPRHKHMYFLRLGGQFSHSAPP